MKNTQALAQKLEELGLSEERKSDLISKYMLADKKLEFKMNQYFKINKPPKVNVQKVSLNRQGLINKPKPTKHVAAVYKPTPIEKSRECFGGYARSFDNRGRPSVDPSYNIDKDLDNEFLNN